MNTHERDQAHEYYGELMRDWVPARALDTALAAEDAEARLGWLMYVVLAMNAGQLRAMVRKTGAHPFAQELMQRCQLWCAAQERGAADVMAAFTLGDQMARLLDEYHENQCKQRHAGGALMPRTEHGDRVRAMLRDKLSQAVQ